MKEKLKSYILNNINYPFKGDFKVDSYKTEFIDDKRLQSSERIVIKVIDADKSIVNFIVNTRQFNLFMLNLS